MRGKRKKQREIGEGTKCARGGMESQTAVEENKESRYTIWQEWSKRDQKNKENIREVGMSAMWPVWRSLHPLRYESSQATRACGGWTPGAGPNRTGCSHSRLAGATIKKQERISTTGSFLFLTGAQRCCWNILSSHHWWTDCTLREMYTHSLYRSEGEQCVPLAFIIIRHATAMTRHLASPFTASQAPRANPSNYQRADVTYYVIKDRV